MITYKEYKNLGYTAVPKDQYARYADMAKNSVMKYTTRRLWESAAFSDDNKRGFCEICDLYYAEINQTGKRIVSFSNDSYKEQYSSEPVVSLEKRIYKIMLIYFRRDQLYRGI